MKYDSTKHDGSRWIANTEEIDCLFLGFNVATLPEGEANVVIMLLLRARTGSNSGAWCSHCGLFSAPLMSQHSDVGILPWSKAREFAASVLFFPLRVFWKKCVSWLKKQLFLLLRRLLVVFRCRLLLQLFIFRRSSFFVNNQQPRKPSVYEQLILLFQSR